MGRRRGQRDASRRHRRLVGGAHRPGSLPALRCQAATDGGSWAATRLVRRAPSPSARASWPPLPGLRRLARRPAPSDRRLRRAMPLPHQAPDAPRVNGWVARSPTGATGRPCGALVIVLASMAPAGGRSPKRRPAASCQPGEFKFVGRHRPWPLGEQVRQPRSYPAARPSPQCRAKSRRCRPARSRPSVRTRSRRP
jgi:hypothetical protein